MIHIAFTSHLEKYVDCPPQEVRAESVREALDQVFESNTRLRGYILDDQGSLRQHIAIFVNGDMVRDRVGLTDAVADGTEIYVMQALSGG